METLNNRQLMIQHMVIGKLIMQVINWILNSIKDVLTAFILFFFIFFATVLPVLITRRLQQSYGIQYLQYPYKKN